MKYYTLVVIVSLFVTSGCQKEMNDNSSSPVSEPKSTVLSDTITNCKWVFTEYHDKVTFQSQPDPSHFIKSTYYMSIISDGNETARIDNNGKIYLNRDYDFNFSNGTIFNTYLPSTSFVRSSYSDPFYDTANYRLVSKSIILSKSVKYLPDTLSIIVADTACLVLSGTLHVNDYEVNRTIILYKNTRWYGGYRSYSWL